MDKLCAASEKINRTDIKGSPYFEVNSITDSIQYFKCKVTLTVTCVEMFSSSWPELSVEPSEAASHILSAGKVPDILLNST